MEKQRLEFNERAYMAHMAEYKAAEKTLNDYLNLLKSLIKENHSKEEATKRINSIDKESARLDLFTGNWNSQSVSTLQEHVKAIVAGLLMEDQKIAGLPVNKAKVYELVDLPEERVTEITEFIYQNSFKRDTQLQFGIDLSKFEIENGKVSMITGLDKELTEEHSIFAENEKELALYNSAKKMSEEVKQLHDKGYVKAEFLRKLPFMKVEQVNEKEPLKIGLNYDFIKQ